MHLPLDVACYPPLNPINDGSLHPMHTTLPPAQSGPELAGIQKLLREVFQSSRTSLQQVERLDAKRHNVHLLHLTDGARMVLKTPPPHLVRLMRNEQRGLETEAQVIELITSKTKVPVPRLVRADPSTSILGSPFILRDHIQGTPLLQIKSHIPSSELAAIDRVLGSHIRTISTLTSSRFGTFSQVQAGRGCASWSEAFLLLLETVLRDGEDMLISLPYDTIRQVSSEKSGVLDGVRQPRLVLLGAGKPSNVLVDESTHQVSGMLGIGNAIWGDPLLATCFADANEAFLEGYGERPDRFGCDHVRQFLYAVYRAVMTVVTQHYRPQQDSEEIGARRALTQALNKLTSLQ
ncbi:hypothetical protein K490DRAFT_58727 [Saccharata proteae CBS 121410]|uniref:Aminoglycoside phosphotransferase domain-containing protein n=1 Tax=Saccharata proteae CBS 121410 TaxID=1314787 RepID=A0A9P4HP75_9PEZI|nr:hypothetical protein K490DRAFT_58727 [Saccharata proteae CBS 121410]